MAEEMKELTEEELTEITGGDLVTPYGTWPGVTYLINDCSTPEEFIKIIRSGITPESGLYNTSDESLKELYWMFKAH